MRKTFTPREIIRILEHNGFVLKRSKGSHRIYVNITNGRKAIVPFHSKTLPPGTLHAIFKDAGISREEV